MAINDSLQNKYDAEVEFVDGESPQAPKYNDWADMSSDAFTYICKAAGDVFYNKANKSTPALMTSLARAIGEMGKLGPRLPFNSSYQTVRLALTKDVRELVLDIPLNLPTSPTPEQVGALITSFAPTVPAAPAINTSLLAPPKGFVTDISSLASGYWTLEKDQEGNYTSKIVAYNPFLTGDVLVYKGNIESIGAGADDAYFNVIPLLQQLDAPGAGLTVTEEANYYKLDFPTFTHLPDGTALHATMQTETLSLPDWYSPLVSSPGDVFPNGLMMIWDNDTGAIVDPEGELLNFVYTGDLVSVRVNKGTTLSTTEPSRYALIIAGLPIANGLYNVSENFRSHDHASTGGEGLVHRHMVGLVPELDDGFGDGDYRFGPSEISDHPDLLSRKGYQTDTVNTNNIMHGDVRFGMQKVDGTNWEHDGSGTPANRESWGINFGDGTPGIRGRYANPGAGNEFMIGLDASVDGENTHGFKRCAGANFLPEAIVSARAHATGNADLRVFASIDAALTAGYRKIFVEEGAYPLSDTLTISDSYVEIVGAGVGTVFTQVGTTFRLTSTKDSIFKIDGASHVKISGIKFVTDNHITNAQGNGAVKVIDGDNIKLEDLVFTCNEPLLTAPGANVAGIALMPTTGAAGDDCQNIFINRCTFGGLDTRDDGLIGIWANDVGDLRVTNCTFGSQASGYRCGNAIYFDDGDNNILYRSRIIANNLIQTKASGIVLDGTNGTVTGGYKVTGNSIVCYGTGGIYGGVKASDMSFVECTGNSVTQSNSFGGVYFADCANSSIVSNSIVNSKADSSGGAAIGVLDGSGVVALNNNIVSHSAATTSYTSGIKVSQSSASDLELVISGNTIQNLKVTTDGASDYLPSGIVLDVTDSVVNASITGNKIKYVGVADTPTPDHNGIIVNIPDAATASTVNATISGNTVDTTNCRNGIVSRTQDDTDSGHTLKINITGNTVTASTCYHGICVSGAADGSLYSVSNNIVTTDQESAGEAAITESNLTVGACSITGNTVSAASRGIYSENSLAVIDDNSITISTDAATAYAIKGGSEIRDNRIVPTATIDDVGSGGIIPTVTGCLIEGNKFGGANRFGTAILINTSSEITDLEINNNQLKASTNGVYVSNNGGTNSDLYNSSIIGNSFDILNTAPTTIYAIRLEGGTLSGLLYSTISGNSAKLDVNLGDTADRNRVFIYSKIFAWDVITNNNILGYKSGLLKGGTLLKCHTADTEPYMNTIMGNNISGLTGGTLFENWKIVGCLSLVSTTLDPNDVSWGANRPMELYGIAYTVSDDNGVSTSGSTSGDENPDKAADHTHTIPSLTGGVTLTDGDFSVTYTKRLGAASNHYGTYAV